jgi:hypothetical protein
MMHFWKGNFRGIPYLKLFAISWHLWWEGEKNRLKQRLDVNMGTEFRKPMHNHVLEVQQVSKGDLKAYILQPADIPESATHSASNEENEMDEWDHPAGKITCFLFTGDGQASGAVN